MTLVHNILNASAKAMNNGKISYVIASVVAAQFAQSLFSLCLIGFSFIAIVVQEVIDAGKSILGWWCNFGNKIAIVKSLNDKPGNCYLPIIYSIAQVLGYLVATFFAFVSYQSLFP
ncbi:hypothetical protein [Paraburkholderia solisilvae]|uniref:hypothetical protein n=1 Tax=Paraburkholderia solisilvae TaxID=624376 RepID=UPI0015833D1A|nr:hypothetical protein [Paraburkholderia solisilvae]